MHQCIRLDELYILTKGFFSNFKSGFKILAENRKILKQRGVNIDESESILVVLAFLFIVVNLSIFMRVLA